VTTRKRSGAVNVLALVAIFVASACAGAAPSPSGSAAASAGPTAGGTVIWAEATPSSALGLNTIPQLSISTIVRNAPAAQVYDTLYRLSVGKGLQNWLAEKTEISADGLMWTLTLRKGVKFHDGSDFDATAVKTNIDTRKTHPTFALKNQLAPIKEVKVVDASTVQFLLTQPAASLRTVLTSPFFSIQSPSQMSKYPEAEYYKHASGTGPFMLEGTPTDTELTLVRNPNYWGEKAYLDKIVYRAIPDPSAAVAALEAGDVQAARVAAADVARMRNATGITLYDLPAQNSYIWFNNGKGITTDLRVRQAMVYGMKLESYLAVNPGGAVADSVVPPSFFGYAKQTVYKYDLDKAKKLLADAGIAPGTPLEFIAGDTGILKDTAQLIVQDMTALGFKVNLRVFDTNTWVANMQTTTADSKWQLSLLSSSGQYDDAEAILLRWVYSPNEPPKGQEWSHYKNPEVDQLLQQQQTQSNPEERAKILARVQEIVWQDLALFSPYVAVAKVGATKALRDLDYQASGLVLWNRVWMAK
jgi:peptide/nickel transport system substrate-binding protein